MKTKGYISFLIILSVPFILQCDKSKLLDEDIVIGILFKIHKHSRLQFEREFHILEFNQRSHHEIIHVNSTITYTAQQIAKLSSQFKNLRRNATRAGYGKNPSGWEYYMNENNEQVKLIIGTVNHHVIINHEVYFDVH